MVACSLWACLTCSKLTSESQSFKETKTISRKEEDAEPAVRTSSRTESWRSLSCDDIPDAGCPRIIVDSEKLCYQARPKKPKVVQYNSVDTLCAIKYGKADRALLKKPSRIPNLKPFVDNSIYLPDNEKRSFVGENMLATTMISDWGDFYEDEDILISTVSNFSCICEDILSESTVSRNSHFSRLGSTVRVKPLAPVQEMPVSPGMVWAMLRTKTGQTFRLLKLSLSFQEVVDTFLKAETGKSLPVSFTLSNDTRPKLLPTEKMDMTLLENLKGNLDEETQGLSFFVGPVNTKLCYKMYVSDLEQLQNFFSIQHVY